MNMLMQIAGFFKIQSRSGSSQPDRGLASQPGTLFGKCDAVFSTFPKNFGPGSAYLAACSFFLVLTGCVLYCMGTFTGASPGAVEKKVQTDPGFEDYGNFPTHNREMKVLTDENMAHEALHWLRVLHTYQDHALAPDQLSEKYLNMSIAATILGGTGHGEFRQQYWSAKAVRYGQMSQNILVGMVPHPDRWVLEEIQTRLLVAMALYYYSGGDITRNDLTEQFKKIDKVFLVRTGFCNNKVLRSLAADHLIELPNCLADVWI